mmetsp:Transcript_5412/g.11953  ORF Transcript_5412/g.11953 Transcript_5412/m.11953 type:complete len:246 (-) Transcript_5412:979-1716(-)
MAVSPLPAFGGGTLLRLLSVDLLDEPGKVAAHGIGLLLPHRVRRPVVGCEERPRESDCLRIGGRGQTRGACVVEQRQERTQALSGLPSCGARAYDAICSDGVMPQVIIADLLQQCARALPLSSLFESSDGLGVGEGGGAQPVGTALVEQLECRLPLARLGARRDDRSGRDDIWLEWRRRVRRCAAAGLARRFRRPPAQIARVPVELGPAGLAKILAIEGLINREQRVVVVGGGGLVGLVRLRESR